MIAHTNDIQEPYQLMVPRNATISDVLETLQTKANLDEELMKKVRVFEAHNNKLYKTLGPEFQIMGIPEYLQLYAWAPAEDESTKKMTAFHYDKDPSKVHGIPFQFSLKEVCL